MCRIYAVALLAVLILSVGWTPAADRTDLEPPDLDRYVRWGPLRMRPGLRLIDVGYDNNIFLETEDPQGSYVATLAPRVDGLVLLGDRAFLTFLEEVRYTAYFDQSGLNYWDQRGTARLTVPFQDFGVFVDGRFDRIRLRPVDLEDIRTRQDLDELGVGAILKLGGRSSLEVRHGRSRWAYADDDFGNAATGTIAERLNRRVRENRAVFSLGLAGRSRAFLEASNRAIRFDTPSLAASGGLPGPERDAREIRLLPGLEFRPGGALIGRVKIGWARLTHRAQSPLVPDYSGLVGEADLLYRPSRLLQADLKAARQVDFAVSSGNNYYVYDSARITLVRYLNRLVGVQLQGTVGELAVTGEDRQDDILRWGGGVRIRMLENELGRRVEYALTVDRERRRSNFPQFNRTRTLVGFNAIVGF